MSTKYVAQSADFSPILRIKNAKTSVRRLPYTVTMKLKIQTKRINSQSLRKVKSRIFSASSIRSSSNLPLDPLQFQAIAIAWYQR